MDEISHAMPGTNTAKSPGQGATGSLLRFVLLLAVGLLVIFAVYRIAWYTPAPVLNPTSHSSKGLSSLTTNQVSSPLSSPISTTVAESELQSSVNSLAVLTTSDPPAVDHSLFNHLLNDHVAPGGWVDYAGLSRESHKLDQYIGTLAEVPFETLSRDEKLALLINAYNAFTLRLILDYYPIKSIKDIPSSKRWKHKRWRLASRVVSLDDIEHEWIRSKFSEPRIHFALVCAAIGCPPLRPDAYTANRLEVQLHDQTLYVHTHDRWFSFDASRNTVHLTKLYKWYGGDFESVAKSVTHFAARYVPTLDRAMRQGSKPRIKWKEYSWTLNDRIYKP